MVTKRTFAGLRPCWCSTRPSDLQTFRAGVFTDSLFSPTGLPSLPAGSLWSTGPGSITSANMTLLWTSGAGRTLVCVSLCFTLVWKLERFVDTRWSFLIAVTLHHCLSSVLVAYALQTCGMWSLHFLRPTDAPGRKLPALHQASAVLLLRSSSWRFSLYSAHLDNEQLRRH